MPIGSKDDVTRRYDLQVSGVVVRTYRTELILLYVIVQLIVNIIDRLFLNSVPKSQWVHMSISPPPHRVELVAPMIAILLCSKTGK